MVAIRTGGCAEELVAFRSKLSGSHSAVDEEQAADVGESHEADPEANLLDRA